MPEERVRDNQWWYSKSSLRPEVEGKADIVLRIDGRECRMRHAAAGADGRRTYAFTFLNQYDREHWVAMRGDSVRIELVSGGSPPPSPGPLPRMRPAPASKLPQLHSPPMFNPISKQAVIRAAIETLFDAYIFLDWSANSTPKQGADSLWIAEGYWDQGQLVVCDPLNPRTREEAMAHLLKRINFYLQAGRRVLLGLDFAYSYPKGFFGSFQKIVGDRKALWLELKERIIDVNNNSNNRFVVANDLNKQMLQPLFWGKPQRQAYQNLVNLSAGKPNGLGNINAYRLVEEQLRLKGRRPMSAFQLYGNGSVGSQVLMGIPRLQQLQAKFADKFLTWPFDTGWCPQFQTMLRDCVLNCEIWPGVISVENYHPVKDASQMISYVYWAAQEDASGNLCCWFDVPARFSDISAADLMSAKQHEGWILGF